MPDELGALPELREMQLHQNDIGRGTLPGLGRLHKPARRPQGMPRDFPACAVTAVIHCDT